MSPKPTLETAFDGPDAKRRYNRRLFATIADRYDFITRFLSFGRDVHWKHQLLELVAIRPGDRVLDLACGTGDLAFHATAAGALVVGLDITPRMIALARARTPVRVHLAWVVGDMMSLPVRSGAVDVITTGYGLRNVPDLSGAIAEMHRVLRPGGRFASLDFDRPESPVVRAIYLSYLTLVGSTVGWLLHRDADTYRYIPKSIARYPGARRVTAMLCDAGFVDVRHVPIFGGLMAIHLARRGDRIQ